MDDNGESSDQPARAKPATEGAADEEGASPQDAVIQYYKSDKGRAELQFSTPEEVRNRLAGLRHRLDNEPELLVRLLLSEAHAEMKIEHFEEALGFVEKSVALLPARDVNLTPKVRDAMETLGNAVVGAHEREQEFWGWLRKAAAVATAIGVVVCTASYLVGDEWIVFFGIPFIFVGVSSAAMMLLRRYCNGLFQDSGALAERIGNGIDALRSKLPEE